jgi:hypothetical protein
VRVFTRPQLSQPSQHVLVRGSHPVVHFREPPPDHAIAVYDEHGGVRPATAVRIEKAVPPDYPRARVGQEREVELPVMLGADALQHGLGLLGPIDGDGEDLGLRTLPVVQQVLQLT